MQPDEVKNMERRTKKVAGPSCLVVKDLGFKWNRVSGLLGESDQSMIVAQPERRVTMETDEKEYFGI